MILGIIFKKGVIHACFTLIGSWEGRKNILGINRIINKNKELLFRPECNFPFKDT